MKAIIYAVFMFLAVSSFAAELPPYRAANYRDIYITGSAEQEDHLTFFMESFLAEAAVMDLNVTDAEEYARFTFSFYVQSHVDEEDITVGYTIFITLTDNETEMEVVSFGWAFTELEDMYEHNEFVFYTAVALIPGVVVDEAEVVFVRVHDDRWQRSRLFLRVSVDYPIAFFELQDTGLFAGAAYYRPDGWPDETPSRVQHLDNIIMPQPGFTLGIEWLFFNFMSIELNFQGHWGDPHTTYGFFNMAAGAQLRYIFRTRNFMFKPYGAITVPLNTSPEFNEFPPFSVGGGIQAGVRGPRDGVLFLDVNLMVSPGDVFRYNPYGALAPSPARIHYRRFVVGLGIGYKFGFFNRSR